eukprot:gnl/MRDRNA2_/MRDRNA2_90283_c0_seq1.p1 gnl/MRDRNA2_/MRDRNA2_90283_c0~~gnl/MRDRNA2_/MRDRNA2_90283_c0_seq1.p1  ORF type:complete len:266 (+),score=82.07 gnl/MRDRNA2_/MRDRNA2_90283_c0_seq1:35-832(+)
MPGPDLKAMLLHFSYAQTPLRLLPSVWIIWITCLRHCKVGAQAPDEDEPPPGTQKMSFKTPDFTEEERESKAMPDNPQLRCDACGIIAQNLAGALLHTEALRKRPLFESQYEAAIEQVCKEGLDEYGAKEVDGKMRFSGPGSFASASAGMIMGGGNWGVRMKGGCRSLVGELEEEEIYKKYSKFVDAPKDKKVSSKKSEAGVQAFVKDICLQKDNEAKGKKKKKKKKQSTQTIQGSCTEELFFFGEKEWKAVLDKRKKDQYKIEL